MCIRDSYSNVTKVMVDSRQGSNLLYLPLDKIMQMTGQVADDTATVVLPTVASNPGNAANAVVASADARARDAARSRTRETR